MDEHEENRISGKGTLARIGRDTEFTSEEARQQGAVTGECGNPAGGEPAKVGQSPQEAERDSDTGRSEGAQRLQDRLIDTIEQEHEGHDWEKK